MKTLPSAIYAIQAALASAGCPVHVTYGERDPERGHRLSVPVKLGQDWISAIRNATGAARVEIAGPRPGCGEKSNIYLCLSVAEVKDTEEYKRKLKRLCAQNSL